LEPPVPRDWHRPPAPCGLLSRAQSWRVPVCSKGLSLAGAAGAELVHQPGTRTRGSLTKQLQRFSPPRMLALRGYMPRPGTKHATAHHLAMEVSGLRRSQLMRNPSWPAGGQIALVCGAGLGPHLSRASRSLPGSSCLLDQGPLAAKPAARR